MSKKSDIQMPELSGSLAVVTGASDGIGLEIARRLARAGAEVLLPVRDRAKGERAADKIRSTEPEARLDLRALDLASLDSVKALADELISEGRSIEILVNNAGIMEPPERRVSKDGLELQFATNHLGHFALNARLMPLLEAGNARVITQTSIAARQNGVRWDDLQWEREYDPRRAYSSSKIANGLFGLEFDRRSRENGWGVTSNVSHPGVSATNLLASRPEMGRGTDTFAVKMVRLLERIGLFAHPPAEAALPALLGVTDPGSSGGDFYGPNGLAGTSGPPARQKPFENFVDPADGARLWAISEELAGVGFPA